MRPAPDFHVFESELGHHLLVADGSRVYDIPKGLVADPEQLANLVAELSAGGPRIDGTPLAPPPLQTLSLNVAQACNMACTYCYASHGSFGAKPKLMQHQVARASVDRLIAESSDGADLVIGFMGGEPFLNRSLLHTIMPYAESAAAAAGRTVRFSLTTNATLLEPVDVALLARHRTQVTISIDGPEAINDAMRPLNGGGSSYHRLLRGIALFEEYGRPHHLSARITVTPRAKDLPGILDHVLSLGFDSAGFAPVLVSPDPSQAFTASDFQWMLEAMVSCGRMALRAILEGRRYPFSNFETALQEIERGSHRPYPCGAGAAYLSVSADGGLYACHRLVEEPKHRFGDVWSGSDVAARGRHLAVRHVDRQEPCRSCWARYLCGGGCYHEVDRRGRPGCDYVRGWLEFCLASYALLKERAPTYFLEPCAYFPPEAAPAVQAAPLQAN